MSKTKKKNLGYKVLNSKYFDADEYKLPSQVNKKWSRKMSNLDPDEYTPLIEEYIPQKNRTRRKSKSKTKSNRGYFFYIRRLIQYTFFLLIGVLIFGSFTFLKYRQNCSYQQLINQGKAEIVSNQDINLCPNIVSTDDWGTIIANAFKFNLLGNIQVSAQTTNDSNQAESCDDPLNPICWLRGTTPEIKQSAGYTNLLLVGLDTREGSSLKNTDTIMLASMHNTSGRILLTSFPRDLHVYYKRPNGYEVNGKINAIYANGGVQGLNYAIEQITGKDVHYYAYIRFTTFSKVIDALGGIDITLEEEFADAYPCVEVPADRECPSPRNIFGGTYGLFKFPAGKNHFDSFDALVYSRARQYSNDYERARRQQEVVRAILKNALTQDTSISDRLNSYLDLYDIYQKEVETNIGMNDVSGVLAIMDKLSDNVAKVVADPNLDGYGRYIYETDNPYGGGRVSMFRDISHRQFQNYLSKLWDYLPYYIENPKVLIVNATGQDNVKASIDVQNLIDNNPYWKYKVITSEEIQYGVRLYDMANGSKAGTLRDLQERIAGSLVFNSQIDQVSKSEFEEDIVIIVGASSTIQNIE